MSTDTANSVQSFLQIISGQAERAIRAARKADDTAPPGVLQLSRLHPADEKLVPTRFAIGDVDRMAEDAIAASAAGHNVYVEARTVRADLRGKKRGELKDTVWVFAINIDSDADKGMAWDGEAQASLVVETSPGNSHHWFFLKQALSAAEAQDLGEHIRGSARADHDSGNATQPYRVAGTINYPNAKKQARGRVATPTCVLEYGGRLWTPTELREAFPIVKHTQQTNDNKQHYDSLAIPADLLVLIRDGAGPDADRSALFFRIVARLKELGWTVATITTLFEQNPNGIATKYTGRISTEVARAFGKVEVGGVTLGDFHAYMPKHNYIFAPNGEPWPGSSVNSQILPIHIFDETGNPKLDQNGKQIIMKASTWLDQNKPVAQMTWAPGLPMLIRNRLVSEGGWIERNGVTGFNLYRPPTIDLGDPAKAGPWLEHVHKVLGDDAEHIIKWCAHRRQYPEVKINHALVLGSDDQGIGKDTLLEPVKRAVGPWNFIEVSAQQMLGRFNGYLKSVILRVNEARDLGEVSRFAFYDHMKAFIASPPDVLRVDEKNLREHNVLNCLGVILTSNHKTTGIYLPAEDRRHFVAWSDRKKEDFSKNYWPTLWGWYDSGGDRHVAAYLAELDISSFDPKAPPHKTEAFWDIVDANRAPEDAELADVLDKMGNPDVTTFERIADVADGEFKHWITDRRNTRLVPHRLEQCGYAKVRNDNEVKGRWFIRGRRQMIYAKKNSFAQRPTEGRL